MAPLMIVNPRHKRRGKVAKKKRRRKMTAKQLKFFGPRKKKAKRAKKAKAKVIVISANPKGATVAKKRRHHRKHKKVFTHNPRKHRRRYRRNPRSVEAGFVNNTLLPAAIGAAGAIGTDMLVNYLPIPMQFKTGPLLPAFKIAAALLVGMAVGAISNREAGEEAAAGGVIVTLYSLAQGFRVAHNASMGRYTPMRRYAPMAGLPPGALKRPGGGANMRGLGYTNPARISPPYGMPTRANMRYLASR